MAEPKINMKPLNDRVVVRRAEKEEKTAGGIIIPESAKEKPIEGKVLAVGEGKLADDGKRIPMQVKEGQTVLFGKYAGTEIKLNGEEYVVLREDDIIGVMA